MGKISFRVESLELRVGEGDQAYLILNGKKLACLKIRQAEDWQVSKTKAINGAIRPDEKEPYLRVYAMADLPEGLPKLTIDVIPKPKGNSNVAPKHAANNRNA